MLIARIPLIFSYHSSLSAIAIGRDDGCNFLMNINTDAFVCRSSPENNRILLYAYLGF